MSSAPLTSAESANLSGELIVRIWADNGLKQGLLVNDPGAVPSAQTRRCCTWKRS